MEVMNVSASVIEPFLCVLCVVSFDSILAAAL